MSEDVNRQAAQAAATGEQGVEAPGSASTPVPPESAEGGQDGAGGVTGSPDVAANS